MVLAALVAVASAAAPVERPEARGPPTTACSTQPTWPEKGAAPPPRETEDPRTAGMPRVDLSPGADNSALGAALAAKVTQPVDLAALPAEPLRGSPEALAAVGAALAAAKTRAVQVDMWGDSLTAADTWPDALRVTLQARLGDAGHGFVHLAPMVQGWSPAGMRHCASGTWTGASARGGKAAKDGRYGWSGFAAESGDATAFAWVQARSTYGHAFVDFLVQPGGGSFRVQVDDTEPVVVSTAGTAAAPGSVEVVVPDTLHRLTVAPVGDGPVRLFGGRLWREAPGVRVDGLGVGGAVEADQATWDPATSPPPVPPDLVVLAYGTNDTTVPGMDAARYGTELRATLAHLRAVAPHAACVLVSPPDRAMRVLGDVWALWTPLDWVRTTQATVAAEAGCATWDAQAAMGGLGSVFQWRLATPPLMGPDHLHATAAGFTELGKRLGAALLAVTPA